jgi:Host cell surface-exposed lipoprotein.
MANLFLLIFFVSIIALVVGLVKPTVFSRFIKGEITRKKIGTIFGIATVASFVLFAITTDSSKNNNEITQQPVVENTQTVTENKNDNPAPVVEKTKTTPAPVPAKTETKTIPAPTPTPTPVSSETISQKNAVKKAKSYLSYSAFSHDGLVAQLEYEQFSHADAVYGADNSGANWNEQAAAKAKSYMEYSAFSRGSLIEQLKYDKFTQAQAEYGANAVGL